MTGRGLLENRVAIVTGAASGIGRGIARAYAEEGAAVAILDRDAEGAEREASRLREQHASARAYTMDVTDYDRYQEVVADVLERFGSVDILVNNAAIVPYGTLLEGTLESWRATLAVNLEALYMGSKLVAPNMVRQQWGRIISISSVHAFVTEGGSGPYDAAKAGITGLTRSMAVELAPYNIAVNAIAPGFVRTAMSIVDGVDETTQPRFLDLYVRQRRIPMARAGEPEDIAGTAVFLASEYCRYTTGQLLVVDGGLTCMF